MCDTREPRRPRTYTHIPTHKPQTQKHPPLHTLDHPCTPACTSKHTHTHTLSLSLCLSNTCTYMCVHMCVGVGVGDVGGCVWGVFVYGCMVLFACGWMYGQACPITRPRSRAGSQSAGFPPTCPPHHCPPLRAWVEDTHTTTYIVGTGLAPNPCRNSGCCQL